MNLDSLFWVAFQSSLLLGLVHGVNPCGHSWLVLAPFVVGEKRGGKAAFLIFCFVTGTTVACLLLGLTLGAVSTVVPEFLAGWVKIGTSVLLLALGTVLVFIPVLIHSHHEEDHGHDHSYELQRVQKHERHQRADQHHSHSHASPASAGQKLTGLAMFGIDFVNMVIPCPTVAIMYGYALNSGSAWKATAIFGVYAAGTAVAVGGGASISSSMSPVFWRSYPRTGWKMP
jgi:nickel/cobalt transporter (NicO) family protein